MSGPGTPPAERRSLRRRIYDLLDPAPKATWDRVVHHGLILLVLANTAAMVLESVPSIQGGYARLFFGIEVVSALIFSVEYLLRLWTAPEHAPLGDRSPAAARLAYAMTPAALVDLMATLPFYLLMVAPYDVRALLLFRMVRFFKLARYSPGLASLAEAVWAERRALMATLFILGSLVILMATIMHLCERAAQPERFGTIPDAMWWAVVTLTTVGYGDAVPVTSPGKMVAGITAVMGLVLIALPVGIIATSFADVIHRREFIVTWSMVARVPTFAGLSAVDLAEIMELLHSVTARKGEIIARCGDPASAMYFPVSGAVEVETRGGKAVTLAPGECFGEHDILADQPCAATLRAREETHLLVLDAQDLRRLMDRVPELGRRIREAAQQPLAAAP